MNCTYTLTHNGQTYEFNSEEELGSFMINNYHRLSDFGPDVSFSKDSNLQAEAVSKIKNLSNFSMGVKYDEFGNKIVTSGKRISATKAISEMKDESGRPLVAPYNEDAFREYKTLQITERLKSENPGLSQDEINNIVKVEIEQAFDLYKMLAKIGTGVHSVLEEYFKNPGITENELKQALQLRPEFTAINMTSNNIIQLIDYVKNIHRNLEAQYPGAIYLPEVNVKSSSGSIEVVGKIDLLIIDKDGNAHILDFKTSPTEYADFGKVKNITNDLQLAIYRQILSQHGFNPSKMDLMIAPIQMLDVDYANKSFTGINPTALVVTKNSALEGGEDLMYNGKWANLIGKYLPVDSISQVSPDAVNQNLQKIDENIFKYSSNIHKHVATYENFIKKFISKTKDGKFRFKNQILDKFVYFDTQEKANEAAREYVNTLEENKLVIAGEVAKEYRKVENETDPHNRVFNESLRKVNFLNKYFKNYLRWGYKINESLISNGILIFYHPSLKVVDFVFINKDDPRQQLFKGEELITGKLQLDRNAPQNTLKATVGNVELMRLMAAANEFMPNLEGFKLQDLKVIDYVTQLSAIQSTHILTDNWKTLLDAAHKTTPIENNFENGKIQIISPEERVINQVDQIINSNVSTPSINKFKRGAGQFSQSNSVEYKIKALNDLLVQLRQEGGTSILQPLHGIQEHDKPMLYFIVANAIAELAGLKLTASMNNISNWGPHSDMLADTAHSPNQVINEINDKVIESARYKIGERIHTELIHTRDYCTKWLKAANTIDTSFNSFDHLIEKSEQDNIFRVLNPYDDSIVMTKDDRDFLKSFLTDINKRRYVKSQGDHTTAEAKALIESGDWFNIPLKRGGVINRGLTFDTLRKATTEAVDKFTNILEVLEPSQIEELGKQEDLFEKYINPMITDGDGIEGMALRNSLLQSKGINHYSRNLAEIAAEYAKNKIKQEEFEAILPLLKVSLIVANAQSLFSGADVEKTLKTLMQKLQYQVYKTQQLDPVEKKINAAYQVLSTVASMVTLPFSVTSFVREMFQGKYNNVGRMITEYGGKDAPDAKSLAYGYGFVLGNLPNSLHTETLMHALNMRYQIFGRSLDDQAESHRAEKNVISGQIFKEGSHYFLNGLSDYYHRMALFVGFVHKGGYLEAYSANKEGRLIYDFDKDPRFKNIRDYAKGGKIKPGDKGLAIYNMMLAEENKRRPENDQLVFGDPLSDGISEKGLQTFKNLANLIHGNLDSDTQMHWKVFLTGKIFTKFQSYIGSKATSLFLRGGKYSMYEVDYEKDPKTGEFLYTKLIKDQDGNVTGVTTTTDFNDSTGEKVLKQEHMYEEGVINTLRYLYEALKDPETRSQNWTEFKEDNYRYGQVKFFIGDMFTALIFAILSGMIDWPEMKEDSYAQYVLVNSIISVPDGNNPFSLAANFVSGLDPMTLKVNYKLLNNTVNYLTKEDYKTKQYLANTYGFAKFLNFFPD